MKPVDLTSPLKRYKAGWVALDKEYQVVAHAQTFSSLSQKVRGKKNLLLVPASRNYFGFVTTTNG